LFCSGCLEATAPPRPLPPEPIQGVWHQLRAGETLAGLARQYRIPLQDIEELNGIERGDPPATGKVIFLPGARADAAPPAAASTRPSPGVEPTQSQPVPKTAAKLLWPVPGGVMTSGFGTRGGRPHEGIDIAAPEGSAVIAAADGVVIYSGSGVRGYGNLILLRHPEGLVTVYAHNRRNRVSEKDRVKGGQVIGEVGRTGNATTNHLHFEVRAGESPRDPVLFVGRGR
jgi:murein DD-endopeptidase MepM/ murein hydrolase activator NlpD